MRATTAHSAVDHPRCPFFDLRFQVNHPPLSSPAFVSSLGYEILGNSDGELGREPGYICWIFNKEQGDIFFCERDASSGEN